VSDAGEVVAVFGVSSGPRTALSVTAAPAGGSFGAPVAIGGSRRLAAPALDVAPDGRTLIAFADGDAIRAVERSPGGAFGAAAEVGATDSSFLMGLSARLAANGAAAIAWRSASGAGTRLVTRGGPGAFFAPVTVASPPVSGGSDPFYVSNSFFMELAGDLDTVEIAPSDDNLVLTPDGRAVVAFAGGDGPLRLGAGVSTVPLAGGAPSVATSRSVFSPGFDARPLVLADGAPAVFWIDEPEGRGSVGARVRMAAEGAVGPRSRPAPRVTIGAPRERTLRGGAALRLPVACSAACDVTIATAESLGGAPLTGAVHLRRAGRATLRITGVGFLARRRPTRVRLEVAYGARGALHPRRRSLTVKVAHRGASLPRITSVRAQRVGSRIRVAVRVTGLDGRTPLFVSGEDTRGWNGEPLSTRSVLAREGRRTVRLSLPADGVRYVAVRLPIGFGPGDRRVARVR
jgi:hypothetical protein